MKNERLMYLLVATERYSLSISQIYSFRPHSADVANVMRPELGSLQVMHALYHVELFLGLNEFNEGIQRLVLDFVFVQEEDLHKNRV